LYYAKYDIITIIDIIYDITIELMLLMMIVIIVLKML